MTGALISGASVCGTTSNGPFDEDLCIRWHQAATFMAPIMRNHYQKSQQQEPYAISMLATEPIR